MIEFGLRSLVLRHIDTKIQKKDLLSIRKEMKHVFHDSSQYAWYLILFAGQFIEVSPFYKFIASPYEVKS